MRGKGRDQLHLNSLHVQTPQHWFPSPCGEKVGINWEQLRTLIQHKATFPSPCGEKVGINPTLLRVGWLHSYPVSVPLRGKGRDQHEVKQLYKEAWEELFPSPCGEKVGINESGVNPNQWSLVHSVSVPLRGKGRDQHPGRLIHKGRFPRCVSVPLRGKGRDQRPEQSPVVAEAAQVSVPLRGKGRDQRSEGDIPRPQPGSFRPLAGKR